MHNKPQIINGGIHHDERGEICFVNDFTFPDIKRFYVIKNHSIKIIRGWIGHKIEKKYFFAVKGSFIICAVKIDDWKNPSKYLKPEKFTISEQNPQILFIPPGYANGVRALQDDSILTVYSNLSLPESAADTYRFNVSLWDMSLSSPLGRG